MEFGVTPRDDAVSARSDALEQMNRRGINGLDSSTCRTQSGPSVRSQALQAFLLHATFSRICNSTVRLPALSQAAEAALAISRPVPRTDPLPSVRSAEYSPTALAGSAHGGDTLGKV